MSAPPFDATVRPSPVPRLTLDLPDEAPAGAPVPIVLRVENPGETPLDLYLRGRAPAFDVVVRRADGSVAWRRLAGEIVPAIVQLRTLAAGERLELRVGWHQRSSDGELVASGDYTVQGLLLTDLPEPLASPPAPLRIVRG